MIFPNNFGTDFDVLIIGGGVVGLALARALHKRNVGKIAVLEKNAVCGSESSNAAAGMLAPQAEADSDSDFLRFACAGRDFYKSFAAEIYDETGIDIELDTSGTLYLAFSEKDLTEIERRFEWQKKSLLAVEKISPRDVLTLEPNVSAKNIGGLFFPNDWQVENKKLIQSFLKYAENAAISLINNATAAKISNDADGFLTVDLTDGKSLRAEKVIVTAGAWTSLLSDAADFLKKIGVEPVRGQIVSFEVEPKSFRHVIYSPRSYLVPRRANRILVGATVEKVGFVNETTAEGEIFLRNRAAELAPFLANKKLQAFESGLRPKVSDGLPVLGAVPAVKNLFISAAHYRNGILLAPLTAEIIAEKIVENKNSRFLETFGADRFE